MAAILGTDRNATIAIRGLRVAFAAFLHGPLFRQFLFFVDRSVDYFVFGTSRWEAEAPRVLPHGIWFLLGHFYRNCVRVLPGAYVWSLEGCRSS